MTFPLEYSHGGYPCRAAHTDDQDQARYEITFKRTTLQPFYRNFPGAHNTIDTSAKSIQCQQVLCKNLLGRLCVDIGRIIDIPLKY